MGNNVDVLLLCFFPRLCVAALSANNFCDNREALYGVFDGDRNVEVPYLLQCTMSDILAEELQKTKNEEEYMINTFIVMQRCVVDLKPLLPCVCSLGSCSLSGQTSALFLLQKNVRGEKALVFGYDVFFYCLFSEYCPLFLSSVGRKTPTLPYPNEKETPHLQSY